MAPGLATGMKICQVRPVPYGYFSGGIVYLKYGLRANGTRLTASPQSQGIRRAAASEAPTPSSGKRHLEHIVRTILLLLLLLPVCSPATQHILLVKSSSSPVYDAVAESIIETLSLNCSSRESRCLPFEVRQITLTDGWTDTESLSQSTISLAVSIGLESARLLQRAAVPIPTLYILLTRSSFASIGLDETDERVSALYLDQPIDRLFNLIDALSPPDQQIAILLGPDTSALEPEITSAARATGRGVRITHISNEGEIGPALRQVLSAHQMLLALPDRLIYSRKNIRSILLFSYYNQIPVIGFSAAYVKAGAMVSVYSSPMDIGRQTAEIIAGFIATVEAGALPRPMFPRYFSVGVNPNVSRSLGFDLERPEIIARRIEIMESQ